MYVITNVSLSLEGTVVLMLASCAPQRAKALVSLAGTACRSPAGLAHNCSLDIGLILLPSTLSYTLIPGSTNRSSCRTGTYALPSNVMTGGVVSTTFVMSTAVVVTFAVDVAIGAATTTSRSNA